MKANKKDKNVTYNLTMSVVIILNLIKHNKNISIKKILNIYQMSRRYLIQILKYLKINKLINWYCDNTFIITKSGLLFLKYCKQYGVIR